MIWELSSQGVEMFGGRVISEFFGHVFVYGNDLIMVNQDDPFN